MKSSVTPLKWARLFLDRRYFSAIIWLSMDTWSSVKGNVSQNLILNRQTYKYYFKNNLILSWNFELGNDDYVCDIFIDDSRSIMLDIQDGKLKSCKLMIKGGNHGGEKRIVMEKFFKNTWMVTGDRWREHMRKFIGHLFKERKFLSLSNWN